MSDPAKIILTPPNARMIHRNGASAMMAKTRVNAVKARHSAEMKGIGYVTVAVRTTSRKPLGSIT
jgi:hypothetical protein